MCQTFVRKRHKTSSGRSGLDWKTEPPVLVIYVSRNVIVLSLERVTLRDRQRGRTGLGNWTKVRK